MGIESLLQLSTRPIARRGDRLARIREAIVTSTLTLAQQGEVAPAVRDIAKGASVSARTVFQHFATTTRLYVAVLDRVLVLIDHGPVLDPQASLDKRVAAIIGHRATRYEVLRPILTFLAVLQRRSPKAAGMIEQAYSTGRGQLADCFSRELSALTADKAERLLAALTLALSPEGWVVLRERLGLPVERACEHWRFMVEAILNGLAGGPRGCNRRTMTWSRERPRSNWTDRGSGVRFGPSGRPASLVAGCT